MQIALFKSKTCDWGLLKEIFSAPPPREGLVIVSIQGKGAM